MRPISDKLIFDRIHADRERVIRYMIYGLFVIAVLPVIIFRDFTPENELRYLCIADESLANGNFFAFTNNGFHTLTNLPCIYGSSCSAALSAAAIRCGFSRSSP